jgi:CubicO group peptidase (beta-lactamase class C family)
MPITARTRGRAGVSSDPPCRLSECDRTDSGGPQMTTHDTVQRRIEDALQPHIDRGELLGLAWFVAVGGDARAGALGHRDMDRHPVTVDSIFRISSMTKPIAVAAGSLAV